MMKIKIHQVFIYFFVLTLMFSAVGPHVYATCRIIQTLTGYMSNPTFYPKICGCYNANCDALGCEVYEEIECYIGSSGNEWRDTLWRSDGRDCNRCGGVNPTAPACDANKLTMEVIPEPVIAGEPVTFRLSGTQGSTFLKDTWLPGGGVNVDCLGDFWGTKTCTAGLTVGSYVWTHEWKNCALNRCDITSVLCSKPRNFTVVLEPPPPTPECKGTCRPAADVSWDENDYRPCSGGDYPTCTAPGTGGNDACVADPAYGPGYVCSGDMNPGSGGGSCIMNINPWGEVRRDNPNRFDIEFTGLKSTRCNADCCDENPRPPGCTNCWSYNRYNQIAPGPVGSYCTDPRSGCRSAGDCQGNDAGDCGYGGSFCRCDDGSSSSGYGCFAREFPVNLGYYANMWYYGKDNDKSRLICCRSNASHNDITYGSNCFSCSKVEGKVDPNIVSPGGDITMTFISNGDYDYPVLHDINGSVDTIVYYDYSSWNNGSFVNPHVLNGQKFLNNTNPNYINNCSLTKSSVAGRTQWVFNCKAPMTIGVHKALFASKQNCESDEISYEVLEPPPPLVECNGNCSGDLDCEPPLLCSSGVCRSVECPDLVTCEHSCPPPVTPSLSCDVVVGSGNLNDTNCKAIKVNSLGLIYDGGKVDCPQ